MKHKDWQCDLNFWCDSHDRCVEVHCCSSGTRTHAQLCVRVLVLVLVLVRVPLCLCLCACP